MNEDGFELNESDCFSEDSIENESTDTGTENRAGKVDGDRLIPDESEVAALQADSGNGENPQQAPMPELTPMLFLPFLEQRRQAHVTDRSLDGGGCY